MMGEELTADQRAACSRFRRGLFGVLQPLLRQLSPCDLLVLCALPETGKTALAKRTGLVPPTVSTCLVRLTESGLVHSALDLVQGGRLLRYDLTPAGEALFLPAASPRKPAPASATAHREPPTEN